MKRILLLILFTTLSCSAQHDLKRNEHLEKCSVVEETFEESQMKKYLFTASNNRDVLDDFIKDDNMYSYLSIIGDEIIYAYSSDGLNWNGLKNKVKFNISNSNVEPLIQEFTIKDIVYKMVCPNNFVVYDLDSEFQGTWIRYMGELKFLYYSTKCGMPCLDKASKKKIQKLSLLKELFEIN